MNYYPPNRIFQLFIAICTLSYMAAIMHFEKEGLGRIIMLMPTPFLAAAALSWGCLGQDRKFPKLLLLGLIVPLLPIFFWDWPSIMEVVAVVTLASSTLFFLGFTLMSVPIPVKAKPQMG
jgi:hypothetical protein